MPPKIKGDDTIVLRVDRNVAGPVLDMPARSVQQQQRRTLASLEDMCPMRRVHGADFAFQQINPVTALHGDLMLCWLRRRFMVSVLRSETKFRPCGSRKRNCFAKLVGEEK